MPGDLSEIIDQLKLERDFLKDGGYGQSVHTPWKRTKLLWDSVVCLNLDETVKQHPCEECVLWDWVPEEHQAEDVPCHFIPLNDRGESIATFVEDAKDREDAEEALLEWLNATIEKLELKLTRHQADAA